MAQRQRIGRTYRRNYIVYLLRVICALSLPLFSLSHSRVILYACVLMSTELDFV